MDALLAGFCTALITCVVASGVFGIAYLCGVSVPVPIIVGAMVGAGLYNGIMMWWWKVRSARGS